METLFAVVWSTEFSLCNRFALPSRIAQIYVLKGVSITFCGLAFFVLMHIAFLVIFQGNEEETLNILRRIYRINNPKSEVEYNVTKVVEDLEFIDNDPGEITNVSQNPFVQFYKQTCLLFSRKYVAKTVLICLIQVHVDCSLNRKYHLKRLIAVWSVRIVPRTLHVLPRNHRQNHAVLEQDAQRSRYDLRGAAD